MISTLYYDVVGNTIQVLPTEEKWSPTLHRSNLWPRATHSHRDQLTELASSRPAMFLYKFGLFTFLNAMFCNLTFQKILHISLKHTHWIPRNHCVNLIPKQICTNGKNLQEKNVNIAGNAFYVWPCAGKDTRPHIRWAYSHLQNSNFTNIVDTFGNSGNVRFVIP